MAQNNGFDAFQIEQAMAFAASPAGKQLIKLVQNMSGSDLGKAQAYAAAGDIEQAKTELASILADSRIQELLRQFGG